MSEYMEFLKEVFEQLGRIHPEVATIMGCLKESWAGFTDRTAQVSRPMWIRLIIDMCYKEGLRCSKP